MAGQLDRQLTPKQEMFARYYVRFGSMARAARECGSSKESSARAGKQMMDRPHVAEFVTRLRAEIAKELKIEAKQVIQAAAAIALHDAGKISQMRTCACEHCWHGWREQHYETEKAAMEFAGLSGDEYEPEENPLPPEGPNPECYLCMGQGHNEVWFADTRDLGPLERIAYQGAYLSKDGKGVELSDRIRCLELLAKHFGLYRESETDITGQVTLVVNGLKLPPPRKAEK